MKKSIAIFGEGPTEWYYIDSLRIAKRYPFTMRPSLPQHSDMKHMLAMAKKCLDEGFDEVVCLMDMDRLNSTPSEMKAYQTARQQKAYRKVTFIETDPCTEYWFLLHFAPQLSQRHFNSYKEVEAELHKYLPQYTKTETYFKRAKLFEMLSASGNLEYALALAKQSSELHDQGAENSYTQMHVLFDMLKKLEEDNHGAKKNNKTGK